MLPLPAEDSRRPWIEPTLTHHDSLAALTQQQYDPRTGRVYDFRLPEDRAAWASVRGSQGFFP